jgi:hypothetical protein
MSLIDVFHWLQETSWATAFRESTLMFPLVEGTHIMALSLSVGIIMILDLRLLGLAFRGEPVSRIMRLIGPWMLTGFAIMLISGLVLFSSQAEKAYTNTFFRLKMFALLFAGLNALYYQVALFPHMHEWDSTPVVPRSARAVAVLSLVLWFLVIAFGRTMAYEL